MNLVRQDAENALALAREEEEGGGGGKYSLLTKEEEKGQLKVKGGVRCSDVRVNNKS